MFYNITLGLIVALTISSFWLFSIADIDWFSIMCNNGFALIFSFVGARLIVGLDGWRLLTGWYRWLAADGLIVSIVRPWYQIAVSMVDS